MAVAEKELQDFQSFKVDPGCGKDFGIEDMPKAPQIKNKKALLAILGPSIIALGGTLGSGEWLIGPAMFVKYGLALLWITTVSTFLQTFLNLEMSRYTIYTGEPITVGFMRLKPGAKFWGPLMSIIGFLERGLPGWALASATCLGAIQLGKIPEAGDKGTVIVWGVIVFLSCVFFTSIGKKVERTLEIANWVMMFVVFVGLGALAVIAVPGHVWGEGIKGFFQIGYIPKGVDIFMLSALAGYSAYGGFGNCAITNWYRDKGYGMGAKVGFIPSLIGGAQVNVSPVGKVCAPTEENKKSWKDWMKLLNYDQGIIFFGGAMLGMFLPAILAVGLIPAGSSLPQWGVAAYQANTFANLMGPFGWFIALFLGFWVLYSTALSNVDLVVRQITDMSWSSSKWIRNLAKDDIRKVYYALLIIFTIWGLSYMKISLPLTLVALGGNIANFTMMLCAFTTIYLNRKFLPKEFKAPVWREVILVACALFFGLFFILFFFNTFLGIRLF
ncbi:MAG: Nramp family divalent metal transporter [Peptococcaceae bacterium]|nr:Nramp family divalent metal transporter [Peptococcaceae bacterium]